jgi:fluoroacetyl-CoA thioesterase
VPIQPGSRAEVKHVVADCDTAIAHNTGSVAVLATPRVVALAEEAAVEAVAGRLPAGQTTVSMRVQMDHMQPTSVGSTVLCEAVLERVEGRRLIFTVHVSDDCGLIAAGRVTRAVVDVERFLERAR